jgi:hypothetical protein
MGERRGAYRVLVGKPEGRGDHLEDRCIWEDNIKTNLREVGWARRGGAAWTGSICLRIGTGGRLL